jgi:cytochrome c oxidase subunit IV
MEKFIIKAGTILSYIFAAISWNTVTQILAIILTLCMIFYYIMKGLNEYLTNKKLREIKKKNKTN